MAILRRLVGLPLALLLALPLPRAGAQELLPVPPLKAHVTDLAGMLDPGQRAALDNVLKEYETRSGSQVAVLLVATTAPEAIEQYGIRVADAWKLGRRGVDDGVILIVAKDNPKALRRLRIEAGRGVQGTLTDAQSKRILQDVIAPHFRQSDFYGGLVAGVSAITGLLDQEHLPAASKGGRQGTSSFSIADWLPFLFLAVIIGIIFRRTGGTRNAFSNDGWGRAAGIIIGAAIGNRMGRGRFGSGDFGGGNSGGGFDGGGGGFDGGGASGDW